LNLKLKEQIQEALKSVLPITLIVTLLSFTIVPIPMGTLGIFVLGALMLIIGMGLFTLGAEMSLTPMGGHIGALVTKKKSLKLMVSVAFVMGFFVTMAEPDLAVLARQVPGIPSMLLIGCVALGVGIFLVIGFLRIVFQKKLSYLLIIFYAVVFGAGIFTNQNYVPVAYDSGGVTTGPITVPFILALGVGVSSVRGGKNAQGDSFGLVAMGSVGPILAMMILGVFFPGAVENELSVMANPMDTREALILFGKAFPDFFAEVAIALLPIAGGFLFFQFAYLKLSKRQLLRICVGSAYTYLGLVLFLTGVNVGFLPVGTLIGQLIGSKAYAWILIPVGMVVGYFIVAAEPAVHVLNEQVELLTGGSISKRAMMLSLSIGVSCSVGLALTRVLTGVSIWWLLAPGYMLAFLMTFFVPPIFTAIAFDSGGVASGAMTATFLLPFTMGACAARGGNIMLDAFGVVSMVAMTPLLTIQGLGLIYRFKARREGMAATLAEMDDEDVVIIDV